MSLYLASEFHVVTCGADGCSQVFAMSDGFYRKTREEGLGWCCPSGHNRIWKGATLSQELETAKARQRHLEDQLHAAEAEAESIRVRLLRDRHRFANGVCPCCNRSFANVRRHVQGEHPEYDPKNLGLPKYRCSCGRRFESLHGLRVHQGRVRPANWANPKLSQWSRHLTVAGS